MTNNLFSDLPASLPDELLTTLLEADNARIERIVSLVEFTQVANSKTYRAVVKSRARSPIHKGMMWDWGDQLSWDYAWLADAR